MKRKFRRYLSVLLSAAILTSSINVPVAAAPQLQTEIRLSDGAKSKMGQGAQMQNNPEQNDLMQKDELQKESNVQVETIFPEKLRTGEVYHTKIEYSGGEAIAYIKASLNGDDLMVDEENQITFSLAEEGRNVLNLKFFDQDGRYLEKVYFMETVQEEAKEETKAEVKEEEKTEELSESDGGNLENGPENSMETESADHDSTEMISGTEEQETQPASEKDISTGKKRAAAKAAFSAVATITSPSVAAVITKPTDIKGTVSGTGITHYTLEYAIANDAFDVSKKEE